MADAGRQSCGCRYRSVRPCRSPSDASLSNESRPRAGDRRQRSAGPPHRSRASPATRSRRSTATQLDLTDPGRRAPGGRARRRRRVIVNCAAFNDVDGAEDRPLEALAVNAFAVRSLALRGRSDAGATLVHYSTDFVFDGAASTPYTEDATSRRRKAPTRPRSCWASGSRSTRRARSCCGSKACSGRPPAGPAGAARWTPSSDGIRAGREVPVFTDRVVSPSYSPDVAAATRHLVDARRARRACITASTAATPPGRSWPARSRGSSAWSRSCKRLTTDQLTLRGRPAALLRAGHGEAGGAGFAMPAWQDALAAGCGSARI